MRRYLRATGYYLVLTSLGLPALQAMGAEPYHGAAFLVGVILLYAEWSRD